MKNAYCPYNSFADMANELKQMIGHEDYLCYDDNGEILFYFLYPIQEIWGTLGQKHPEETGQLFECIRDVFQEAFYEGIREILLDVSWFSKRIGVSMKMMPALIENIQFLRLIQCEIKSYSKYPDPVMIASPTDFFLSLTGMKTPLNQYWQDADDLHEEKPIPEQRTLH